MGLAMIKPSSLICVLAVTLVGNGQTNSQKEGQKDIAAIAKETNGAGVFARDGRIMNDRDKDTLARLVKDAHGRIHRCVVCGATTTGFGVFFPDPEWNVA